MHNMIQKIIVKKQQDIKLQKQKISLEILKNKAEEKPVESTFYDAIKQEKKAIIAELKFASPSAGVLGSQDTLLAKAKAYKKANVAAISVITEEHFFYGKREFVLKVKQVTKLPILQKDFVIDIYQIYQAAILGSDALLFIARFVPEKTLQKFVLLAQSLGIEPVVEIVNKEDLDKAMTTTTRIIAVNSRDLNTFKVSVPRASRLLSKIPVKYEKLGFSGISTQKDAASYFSAGANGILIGTTLMKEVNVDAFISSLR